MFLPGCFFRPLAAVDDSGWQAILDRHGFWREPPPACAGENVGIAFHVLMANGVPASRKNGVTLDPAHEFEAIQVPEDVLEDPAVLGAMEAWAEMHTQNCGEGCTIKLGVYVVHPNGVVGYHVDGPVFLQGEKADLADADNQQRVMLVNASRRTILPLRVNANDEFLVCRQPVPLERDTLFEFNNMLPHAYFNRGTGSSALLVTTYLVDELMPRLPDA